MQLPLTLKVYLVDTPSIDAADVRTALAPYNDVARGTGPVYDALEVIEADALTEDMRGYAILLGDESQLDVAASWVGDTAVATVGVARTQASLLALGLTDALPASPTTDELACALVRLAREALLRRKLDIRQFAFDTYYRISDNMLWTKDLRDYHMDVNHFLTTLTGKTLEQIEGLHEIEVYGLNPDDPGCGESDRIVREEGVESTFEESMPDAAGTQHHLSVVKTPWRDGQGRIIGTIGIAKDTTELLNQLAKFDTFLNSIGLAVAITDTETRLLQANSTFFRLVGADDIVGELVLELVPERLTRVAAITGPTLVHSHAGREEEASSLEGDYAITDDDGVEHIWDLDRFYLTNYWGDHTGFAYILQDVTEDRNQRREISQLAVIDPLTCASNRTGMYADFLGADPASHATFLFVDIDDFKQINDGLGHSFGDRYLVEVAHLLRQVMPEAHLTRYGGDEFFAWVPGAHDAEEAASLATRILEDVKALPVAHELPKGVGSLSIGIVPDACFSEGADEIIGRCDDLMYAAKRAGKHRFCIA